MWQSILSSWTYLKQHIHGVHEINKGHQCDSCGNSFSTKRTLKNHFITIHSQIDPDLNQNIDLKSEKPDDNDHECDFCGELFSASRNLKIHKRKKHLKPSQINLPDFPKNLKCEADFSQPGRIKLKIFIPRQEPPDLFNCQKCEKKFDSQVKLSIHKKRNHQEHNFKCGKCDKSYKSQSGLEFHEKLQHPAMLITYPVDTPPVFVAKKSTVPYVPATPRREDTEDHIPPN